MGAFWAPAIGKEKAMQIATISLFAEAGAAPDIQIDSICTSTSTSCKCTSSSSSCC